MDDYIIRYIDLPLKVGGVTVLSSDGFSNIYINRLLPDELQEESLDHEMSHISKNHLYTDIPVDKCEREASQ